MPAQKSELDELSLDAGERWFAVLSQPHREAGAKMQLEAQGFRVFLPRIKTTIRHARKMKTIHSPLFPRYLFIVLDLQRDRWRSVNGTYGVSRLVMQADRPLAAPQGVIEPLIACADPDGLMHFDEAGGLRVGQEVEVMAGPFVKRIGQIERLDAHGRVRLLLDLLGQKTPVTILRTDVMPAA